MRPRLPARLALVAVGLLIAFSALPGAVSAANPVIVVNQTYDGIDFDPSDGICETHSGNGECTLRAAVMEANARPGADVIQLDSSTYAIGILGQDEEGGLTGDLDVFGDLTIHGAGMSQTTVQASPIDWTQGVDRLFEVYGPGNDLSLDGLTLRRGNSGPSMGGGISVNGLTTTLHLSHVRMTENHAPNNAAGAIINWGTAIIDHSLFDDNNPSAITSYGPLTVTDTEFRSNSGYGPAVFASDAETQIRRSLFTDNHSQGEGTGIYLGTGAVGDSFHAVIENTTFDGNTTTDVFGAAIYVRSLVDVDIQNATIASNDGVGIYADPSGTVNLRNSIVAYNTIKDCSTKPDTHDHSIDSDGTCGLNGPGDKTAANVFAAGLADNGGPTRTRALLSTSPAIDAGSNCAATDQRAIARPIDGDSDGNAVCDMGAFEAADGTSPPPSPTPTPSVTPTPAVTPTPSVTPTPVPTGTPTPTPIPTPVVTPSPVPSATPDPTPTPSAPPPPPSHDPSPTPVVTPSPTPSSTPDPTPPPTPDPTPDPTPSVTPEPTPDPTPSVTPDPTPSVTPDPSDEPTPDPTPRPTPVSTPDPSDDGSSGGTEPGPDGGVQGETGGPHLTPPPTDTIAVADGPTQGSSGWVIVALGLAIAVMAAVMPDRRRRPSS